MSGDFLTLFYICSERELGKGNKGLGSEGSRCGGEGDDRGLEEAKGCSSRKRRGGVRGEDGEAWMSSGCEFERKGRASRFGGLISLEMLLGRKRNCESEMYLA